MKAGFTQVGSVSGGITAWVEAGYPVEPYRLIPKRDDESLLQVRGRTQPGG